MTEKKATLLRWQVGGRSLTEAQVRELYNAVLASLVPVEAKKKTTLFSLGSTEIEAARSSEESEKMQALIEQLRAATPGQDALQIVLSDEDGQISRLMVSNFAVFLEQGFSPESDFFRLFRGLAIARAEIDLSESDPDFKKKLNRNALIEFGWLPEGEFTFGEFLTRLVDVLEDISKKPRDEVILKLVTIINRNLDNLGMEKISRDTFSSWMTGNAMPAAAGPVFAGIAQSIGLQGEKISGREESIARIRRSMKPGDKNPAAPNVAPAVSAEAIAERTAPATSSTVIIAGIERQQRKLQLLQNLLAEPVATLSALLQKIDFSHTNAEALGYGRSTFYRHRDANDPVLAKLALYERLPISLYSKMHGLTEEQVLKGLCIKFADLYPNVPVGDTGHRLLQAARWHKLQDPIKSNIIEALADYVEGNLSFSELLQGLHKTVAGLSLAPDIPQGVGFRENIEAVTGLSSSSAYRFFGRKSQSASPAAFDTIIHNLGLDAMACALGISLPKLMATLDTHLGYKPFPKEAPLSAAELRQLAELHAARPSALGADLTRSSPPPQQETQRGAHGRPL